MCAITCYQKKVLNVWSFQCFQSYLAIGKRFISVVTWIQTRPSFLRQRRGSAPQLVDQAPATHLLLLQSFSEMSVRRRGLIPKKKTPPGVSDSYWIILDYIL